MARKIDVTIGENGYNMDVEDYRKFLVTTRTFIEANTIYAIERKNLAVMLNDVYPSTEELHNAVNSYMNDGFKVHFTIENEVKN